MSAIVLFDVDANPIGWTDAIDRFRVQGNWDLGSLPDFGVTSASGPLTSSGVGPIPAGFLPDNVIIDSSRFFATEPITLAFVGPSANGLNNSVNAVLPNQPQDSLNIWLLDRALAFEFTAISCDLCAFGPLGLIDITVTDGRGEVTSFIGIDAPSTGHRFGLLATRGDTLDLINLSGTAVDDTSSTPNHGFPGISGSAVIYGRGVPEPTSIALVSMALAGLLAARRRRRMIYRS